MQQSAKTKSTERKEMTFELSLRLSSEIIIFIFKTQIACDDDKNDNKRVRIVSKDVAESSVQSAARRTHLLAVGIDD